MADVEESVFGKTPDGRDVKMFTLSSGAGVTVRVMERGATVTSILAPDREGKVADIVLGCDTLEDYLANYSYMGAIVGRYGNRLGGARFDLDGETYRVTANEGGNQLHGGWRGFDKVVWEGRVAAAPDGCAVAFRYLSPDGEEGYPGALALTVTYTLTRDNRLRIGYEGTTDKPTVLNPTHHSYFNLTGDPTRTVLGHRLAIAAAAITPTDAGRIPTGEVRDVTGTPFDFRPQTGTVAREIGFQIDATGVELAEQLAIGGGYDHNFVLRKDPGAPGGPAQAAEVFEPEGGRVLTVFTDQPGMQFYSGNGLSGSVRGKGGVRYGRRTGFCLEAQNFPDAPNQPRFPSAVLRPGEVYRQVTVYGFSARG
ncbi:MAG: galactose mutarotase [Acidobacteriota bacterium]|jgi:aldose 1-epimerase|nr:galactose mutarotase [Acidobacteriota bacterium]